MKYDNTSVVEIKGLLWKYENKYITFEHQGKKVILNNTASIIWRLMDGNNSINDIIDKIYEMHHDENSREYIQSIVYEFIDMIEQEGHIIIKENDEFGGWFQYE